MSIRQKVLSGLAWNAGAKFCAQLFSWAITVFIMRSLDPADYGLMAMASVFVSYLVLLNELGLSAVLVQEKHVPEDKLRKIFGLLLVTNSLFFILSLAFAPVVAAFFKEHRVIPIFRVLSIQFLIICFAVLPQSTADRNMDFKKKSIVDLISAVAASVGTLMLALNGLAVWSLVIGSLALATFRTISLNIIWPCLPLPLFSCRGMKRTLSFGGHVIMNRTLWFMLNNSDVFIIGRILGRDPLGVYSLALHLASLPMQKVSSIVNQVAFPAFARIQTEPKRVTYSFLKSVRIMSILSFPLLWGISSLAPELILLILGEKWQLCIVPLRLISLVVPLRMTSNLFNPAVLGVGRPKVSFFNLLSALVIMSAGMPLGAFWGINGVSVVWVTLYPVVFLLNLSRTVPVLGARFTEVLSAMAKPALSAFIMYVVILSISKFIAAYSLFFRISLLGTLGALVYTIMILWLYPQGCREVLRLIRSSSARDLQI
ncbi:MAG: hypothetical protein CVU57_12875 [Deltaproteobacteria bacterium HGW-Deltaproteobacteria-15]|jgi:O-antigen/teichoic acid export membrane protein|nr:MAG: hypothetical protein CVU57_12875 [Deltaproteobacteria bacterium HGW-Deltaproteobacteria-15]